MKFLDLAKLALPGATDDEAKDALWNYTPFPFDKTPRVLFKKLSGYRRACANRIQLCEFCSNKVTAGWVCDRCASALHSHG